MSTTTILHLSDLHRSKGNEISNKALLVSLINDRDRYTTSETPRIKTPDIIIVSGDIIRGSTNDNDSDIEIKEQYEEARTFLTDLTKEFLSGDKNKLIIIPGNHDIDWKYSKQSMSKIDSSAIFDADKKLKTEILKDSINQNSTIRWSWKDLSFYKITDISQYDKRFEAFSDFYSTFYESKRKYSINPSDQVDVFDFPDSSITIVAFNSCFNNDHLRLVGDIHPDCIASISLKLREFKNNGRLILATWHHSTKGLPYDSDYMDNGRLKNFIDTGISVGFHGHQHKTELIQEYSDIIEKKKIIVFSAGTICGGPNELPVGNNRQYNLIEIVNTEGNSKTRITLHVREKTESSSFDNPIWTAGRIDSKNTSFYSIEIEKPLVPVLNTKLVEIEKLIRDKEYESAKKLLIKLDLNNAIVRKFLTECILQTEDYNLALTVLVDPITEEELVVLLNSAIHIGDKGKMKIIADRIKLTSPSNRIVLDLISKIEGLIR